MDLRTAADSESLAKLYQPAALLDPPSGDVVGKVSFVQQADGTVQLVATRSLPILSLDLVVLAEDSIPSPTEFYLVLAMQLPVWFQEKLWLRQVRDRARSDIIGREFIQHATTPLTGIGSPLPKQFDLGSDPPAELSRSEAMSVSAETLVRRLLDRQPRHHSGRHRFAGMAQVSGPHHDLLQAASRAAFARPGRKHRVRERAAVLQGRRVSGTECPPGRRECLDQWHQAAG
jgi:hypothetical protein